ncbi:hypothetical protein RND71_015816 [Anisodus tanguticus]|uniref:Uncharacterized protein n=1 Tax=Anisodus tanguticus TaxID=243964 RepID=A0AAE1S865_9SOLA|nr:hypothetical protein RND71_015816 [Anisodus tanguticus]
MTTARRVKEERSDWIKIVYEHISSYLRSKGEQFLKRGGREDKSEGEDRGRDENTLNLGEGSTQYSYERNLEYNSYSRV